MSAVDVHHVFCGSVFLYGISLSVHCIDERSSERHMAVPEGDLCRFSGKQ